MEAEEQEQEDLLIRITSDNEDFSENEEIRDCSDYLEPDNRNLFYDKVKLIAFGLLLLFFSTALVILLPLYTECVNRKGDVYTLLFFSCTMTVLSLIIVGCIFGKFTGSIKRVLFPPFDLPALIRIGLLYALSSVAVVYAVDRRRVVCHLQDPMKGLILVMSLVYYFFLCRKMMGLQKIFCATTIIVGLFISVDYGLCNEFRCRGYEREDRSEDAGDWSWRAHFVWTLVYVLGLALWSLHHTLLEGQLVLHADMMSANGGDARVSTVSRIVSTIDTAATHSRPLLQLNEEDQEASPRKDHRHIAYMKSHHDTTCVPSASAVCISLWIHVISLGVIIAVCWTDMIPVIGKSSSAREFWDHFHSTLACHFGHNNQVMDMDSTDTCFQTMFYGWLFFASYLAFTVCSTKFLIISESSVFTLALMTAALPLSGIWWSLFSMVGLSADSGGELVEWMPMVTGELICSVLGLPIVLVGLVLFTKAHFWEMSYDRLVFTCLRHQSSEP